jgi:hypothetical protein
MSRCLYKHRSRPIDVSNNRTNTIYFYPSFYPSFSTFSSSHRLDLLCTASTPWVAIVLAYLSSRRHLDGGETPSSSVGGAPDCRQNRQNQTIRFAKSDSPIFPVLSKSFQLLFDSCGNKQVVRFSKIVTSLCIRSTSVPRGSVQFKWQLGPFEWIRKSANRASGCGAGEQGQMARW